MEYCLAVYTGASAIKLKKLDTIQKICARIICGAPRDAHAAPLLAKLKLHELKARRNEHVVKLVQQIVAFAVHPDLANMFMVNDDLTVENGL